MSEKKLWGGRFKQGLDPDAKAFSYSLHFDHKLAPYDVAVNRAHCKALHQKGIISSEELADVEAALTELAHQFSEDPSSLLGDDEDIHSCIERLVTAKLGDLGKKIHTGKSRNDQVITDVRLYQKDQITTVISELEYVLKALFKLATQTQSIVFPGFTHFQTAQPVLLAHHFLAYFNMFERDLNRFKQTFTTTDVCPLGSGALAGNNYELDREFIAKELGFARLTTNSMDGVADRDFIAEFLANATLCFTHLTRSCEELVLWSSPLLGFITIGDSFTTGSSIMPQKKNPDIAELIRGKSGRVLGHFNALQLAIKALPLTYNRDLQEDKEMLFDTAQTLIESLRCYHKMIGEITFHPDVIQTALEKGYILATEFADYLVKKGVPFRDSHEITGQVVLMAESQNIALEDIPLSDFKTVSEVIDEDVYDCLQFQAAVDAKNVIGGTASNQVQSQLNRIAEAYQWQNIL